MNYYEQKILDGKAVLFLGAGASYNCTDINGTRIGFTGNELLLKISQEFLGGEQQGINLDFASTMAINIAGRSVFDQFLKDLVKNFEPTPEHDLITKFNWKAIYTTNYDEAIERAYLNNRKEATQTIEKILCDNDSLQKAYSEEKTLPLIKIHGCISRLNDSNLPMIISRSDYRYHMENRSGLFQSLKESLSSDIVIFYGYGLNDQNIIGLLSDLDRENKSRARHIWLDPYMADLQKQYWEGKNLDCNKVTLFDFLNNIIGKKTKFQSVVSVLKNDSCISKLIPSHDRPNDILEEYLKFQLIYTKLNEDRQREIDNYNKELFYRGNSLGFGWVGQNLDFGRSIFEILDKEVFVESELSNNIFNFYLIDGYAGSGKTVLLKRLAWAGSNIRNKPCFYLAEGASLNVDLVIELLKLVNETIYLFVDDILSFQNEVYKLYDFSKKSVTKIILIGTTRTNEWNNSSNLLDGYNPSTFNLRDLNDSEIRALISKLKHSGSEGNLKDLSEEQKFKFIKENNNKQLLVTLLEATHQGQEFAEIIKDEYECIYERSAQDLYLNICSLHKYGIELRAGMIKRLSGIDFDEFKHHFLLPLELLVVSYYSHRAKDYVYVSRHPNIAENVYAQAFLSEMEKAQQLIRIIRYLNISYDTDKSALETLLKGRGLAQEFTDKNLVNSIFAIALEIGLNKSYIFHQKAIFEMNHKSVNLNLALEYIKEIDNDDSFYDMRTVNHTRANIYRKLAQSSTSIQDKNKYRSWGLKLLNENIRTSIKSSMPYVTKGYLLLDEIKDCSNEELIVDIVKDFESNLSLGYKKFPYDEALMALEHDFSKEIDNLPRALKKLEEALRKNSDNIYLVKRYAKFHMERNDFDIARKALNDFLRNHMSNKEVNFLMAQSYLKENEKENVDTIIKYLKRSYSPNDNSFEEKFMHARLEYIYKSEDKAFEIFNELSKTSLPGKIKNKGALVILDNYDREKIFDGYVVTVNSDYGFIKCSQYKENIYVHKSCMSDSETWDLLKPNDPVKISIWFTFRGPRVKTMALG